MTTEDRLRTFIAEELPWAGERSDLTPDFPLIDGGVLDSAGIVQMVSFLEADFGIKVGDEEVIPANFETIDAVSRFVEAKRSS